MKKRRWDRSRATRAIYNKAVDAALRMNGASIGRKYNGQDGHLVFGIGDSQFGEGTNTAFEKYFVSKVKSLGYDSFPVNERNTSKRCSQGCGADVKYVRGIRVVECPRCKVRIHRDCSASENIARCLAATLKGKGRPGNLFH